MIQQGFPLHVRRKLISACGIAGLVLSGCSAHDEPTVARKIFKLPIGEFQPTSGQWANLTIVPVRTTKFGPALLTDGQIATDDDHTTQLSSPFSGRISRIFVKPGDVVRRGQPIYAIAASELVQGHSDVATAQATVAGARKALSVAETNASRQQALLAIQGAALRDVQQSQADLATARANATTAAAQLTAARGRLNILGIGDAGTGSGSVAIVRSPINGTVTTRQAGVGQYLQSAAGGANLPLFTISDLSHVWLVANVREVDASKLRRGAALQVSVPAFPGRTFASQVYYVAPLVDQTTRRIAVRAQIANPDGALRPNMFASARLSDGPTGAAVEIPVQAVLYEGDDAHVWVAHLNRHTLSLRAVKTAPGEPGSVAVTQGLSAGDRVVSAGSVFIDRANGAN